MVLFVHRLEWAPPNIVFTGVPLDGLVRQYGQTGTVPPGTIQWPEFPTES